MNGQRQRCHRTRYDWAAKVTQRTRKAAPNQALTSKASSISMSAPIIQRTWSPSSFRLVFDKPHLPPETTPPRHRALSEGPGAGLAAVSSTLNTEMITLPL